MGHTQHTCVLCGVLYDAPANLRSYQGLCPEHWQRDILREMDRLAAARDRLPADVPNTLTLQEWLAIIASWEGQCALCRLNQSSVLAIWVPNDGLVAGNVAPLCRACEYHRQHSFLSAMDRVSAQLAVHVAETVTKQ